MKKRNKRWYFLILASLVCLCPAFSAGADPIEHPFGYGKTYAGLQLGYGLGMAVGSSADGDVADVEYLATFPSLAVGISDLIGENAWYRGNFDIVAEGEFITNFTPSIGYSAGLALLLRYNLRYGKRLIPYFEVGSGVGYFDFDLRRQANGLIFYPQAGLGAHYLLTDRVALNASWRLHHMSNAGTEKPNRSINASLILVGLSYHFD